jgi:hypothetical protein
MAKHSRVFTLTPNISNDADEPSNDVSFTCTGVMQDIILENGFEDLP